MADNDEQIQNLRTVTDSNKNLDAIMKDGKHVWFRCLHSFLLFPGDYLRLWGKKYGIGLGGEPRSECLDSIYNITPYIGRGVRDIEQIMHPVKISGAPLDYVLMSPAEAAGQRLITSYEDVRMMKRGRLLLAKQLENPRSQVALFRTKFLTQGGIKDAASNY